MQNNKLCTLTLKGIFFQLPFLLWAFVVFRRENHILGAFTLSKPKGWMEWKSFFYFARGLLKLEVTELFNQYTVLDHDQHHPKINENALFRNKRFMLDEMI